MEPLLGDIWKPRIRSQMLIVGYSHKPRPSWAPEQSEPRRNLSGNEGRYGHLHLTFQSGQTNSLVLSNAHHHHHPTTPPLNSWKMVIANTEPSFPTSPSLPCSCSSVSVHSGSSCPRGKLVLLGRALAGSPRQDPDSSLGWRLSVAPFFG